MRCLHCGKRLTLLHQLKQRDFCSEEHARAYSEEQEQLALRSEAAQKYLEGATPKKVVVVPKKLVNFVL